MSPFISALIFAISFINTFILFTSKFYDSDSSNKMKRNTMGQTGRKHEKTHTKIPSGSLKGKSLFRRPRRRRQNKIKMNLRETV